MSIPSFQAFMVPVLEAVQDGTSHARAEVIPAVIDRMDLSEEQLAERLKGGASRAGSRVVWAMEYLFQAGAIERPARGTLRITEVGHDLLEQHPGGLTRASLEHLPGYQAWRERSLTGPERRRNAALGATSEPQDDRNDESPLERLIEAVDQIDQATAAEVVERIQSMEPIFMEKAVLRLLHAMGYGGSEDDTEHLGKSHDGGLDGVIRQDALGIERIYVQAKRYKSDSTVGASAIREFVGALTGAGAAGGVFITTSTFSIEATKYAEHVKPRVILINGTEFGRLMVEYGVGVMVTQTLDVTEVDENFFEY